MIPSRHAVFAALFAAVVAALLVGLAPGMGGDTPAEPGVRPPRAEVRQPPPAQPLPAPQSASVLPPPKAAQEPAGGEAKPKRKVITLAEAVTIAEKAGRGQATKAERKDRPEVNFKVEVVTLTGEKKRIDIAADGKVLATMAGDGKSADKKGKKK